MIIECKQTRSVQTLRKGMRLKCPCGCGGIFTLIARMPDSIWTQKDYETLRVNLENPDGFMGTGTDSIPIPSSPDFVLVK